MKVEHDELIFIKQNAPRGFAQLIFDSLESQGQAPASRIRIHKEISTLKGDYNPVIIVEARRLLKAIKGVKYNNTCRTNTTKK